MRFLLHILVAAMLATLVVAGVLLVILNREDHRVFDQYAQTRSKIELPKDSVGEPGRVASTSGQPVEAVFRLPRRRRGPCQVTLTGPVPLTHDLVVAIMDEDTGTRLAMRRFHTGTTPPRVIEFEDLRAGLHWISVAQTTARLRFAYISRQRMREATGNRSDNVLRTGEISYATHKLIVSAKDERTTQAPLQLRRLADKDWYCPQQPIRESSDSRSFAGVGTGTFELIVVGLGNEPDRNHRVELAAGKTVRFVVD